MKRSQILSIILLLAFTVFSCLTTTTITVQQKGKAEIALNPNRKILLMPALISENIASNSPISYLMEDSMQQYLDRQYPNFSQDYFLKLKSAKKINEGDLSAFSPWAYSEVCKIMDNEFLSTINSMNQWEKVISYQPSLNDLHEISLGKSYKDIVRGLNIDTIIFPIVTKLSSNIEYGWDTDSKMVNKFSVLIKIFDVDGNLLVEKDFSDMESIITDNDYTKFFFSKMIQSAAKKMQTVLVPKTSSAAYTITYDKDDDPRMKEAADLSKKQEYMMAKDLFVQIFNEAQNISAAANAAIMYRALDDLAGGVAFLEEAVRQTQNKKLELELDKMKADLIEREKFI